MSKKGEILSEEDKFHGAIFDVVTREIKTPDGLKVKRDVVLHGDAVAMIMPLDINGETKYVIGSEYRAGKNETRSSFPAGLLEVGEDPIEAAIREAREEIGLVYKNAKLLFTVSTSEGFTNETTYIMLMSNYVGKTETEFDESEFVVPTYLTLEELGVKIKNQEITTAPAIIGYQHLLLNV
jgi:ADP-ribose pyrophosphatase